MKVALLDPEGRFRLDQAVPVHAQELTCDLGLEALWATMAADDRLIFDIARSVVLRPPTDPAEIRHRQAVLADCRASVDAIRALYEMAEEAIAAPRHVWGLRNDSPHSVLRRSVQKMELLVPFLEQLRVWALENQQSFCSDGLSRLCATLIEELDPAYLDHVRRHLIDLNFKGGMLLGVQLGRGNVGIGYTLRRRDHRNWLSRALDRSGYRFAIDPRDDAGTRALDEVADRGANTAGNAVAQSVDHVMAFFTQLRVELAFYIGAVNLHRRMAERGAVCVPTPRPAGTRTLAARGLRDVVLMLTADTPVIANDLVADGCELVMFTGANQGGKSTFMRAIGVAQLMMQAGLSVTADSFEADVATGVFTHYKRAEDETLEHGKLEEELARMSQLADAILPGALLLCNESFAATNEREGSEIARQIVRAMLEHDIRIVFVTHMFDLADS
ncbi:MAG TPA: hypothetical protein VIK04_06290, partial [Solirubrobacteraceae bacterium]